MLAAITTFYLYLPVTSNLGIIVVEASDAVVKRDRVCPSVALALWEPNRPFNIPKDVTI